MKEQLENLDARLARIEQFLPSLATKDDVRDEAIQTRRHFDIVAESLRDDIKVALEGNMAATSRIESLEHRHARLERRVTDLEIGPPRPTG